MQGREGLNRLGLLLGAILLAVALTACPKRAPEKTEIVALDAAIAPVVVESSAARGKELVAKFECNRCHDGTGQPNAPQNKNCVGCHKDIVEDRFTAAAASLVKWKGRVKDLADAPSLDGAGHRFTRKWIEGFLLQPDDLRPHLVQSMPRLAVTLEQARDIAAYLAPDAEPMGTELEGADLAKGRVLLDTKGCGTCHAFSGVADPKPSAPPAMDAKALDRSKKLAPDLKFARERTTPARLLAWLRDPKAVKADSDMPKIDLTEAEAKDLAGYIWSAQITPPPAKPKDERLPLLTRKVTFKEVDEKVLHRTCWHCHSEPDYAIGDGGPGNSGGFGFKPRGLNLSAYAGMAAGYLDEKDERHSIFAKDADGVPRIVRAMLARHDEERGAATGPVRGMPLGYPSLSLEEIQLVDTWVAQGWAR